MSEINDIADQIYEAYNPESRGKSPSVTRAACEYLAHLHVGQRDDIDQEILANEYGCSAHAIRNRKNQIIEEIELESQI